MSERERGQCGACGYPYGSKLTLFRLQTRKDSIVCPGCQGIYPAWAYMPDEWLNEWRDLWEVKDGK